MLDRISVNILQVRKINIQIRNALSCIIIFSTFSQYIFASRKIILHENFDFESKLFIATDSVDLQKIDRWRQNGKIIKVFTNPNIFSGDNSFIPRNILQDILEHEDDTGKRKNSKYFLHIHSYSSFVNLKNLVGRKEPSFKFFNHVFYTKHHVKKTICCLALDSVQEISPLDIVRRFDHILEENTPVCVIVNDINPLQLALDENFIVKMHPKYKNFFLLKNEPYFTVKHFHCLQQYICNPPNASNIVAIFCCNLSYLNKSSNYGQNRGMISVYLESDGCVFLIARNESKISTISIFKLLFDDIKNMEQIKISDFYSEFNRKNEIIKQFGDLNSHKNCSKIIFVTPHMFPAGVYEIYQEFLPAQNYGCFENIQVDENIRFKAENGESITFEGVYYHRFVSKQPLRINGPVFTRNDLVKKKKCLLICMNELLELVKPIFSTDFDKGIVHPHISHLELCRNRFGDKIVLLYPNKVAPKCFIAALGCDGYISISGKANCSIYRCFDND